jgi:hypothetical protein
LQDVKEIGFLHKHFGSKCPVLLSSGWRDQFVAAQATSTAREAQVDWREQLVQELSEVIVLYLFSR